MSREPTAETISSARDILRLGSYEHVRKRPGMYIGDTGVGGLHHLALEIISNAIAEVYQRRFRWQYDDPPRVWSLCNGQTTIGGGTHVSGFYRGVTRAVHRSMPNVRRAPGGPRRRRSSAGEDMRAGIVAILSVESPDPSYYGSTKDRVENVEFDRLTAARTESLLTAFFADHPDEARRIAQHLEAPTPIDPKTGR